MVTAADTGSWDGRRVLITGAAGFVGSWLTDTLADSGAHVRALVGPAIGAFQRGALNRAGVEIVEGSVEDAAGIERLVRSAAVDSVFHLAAVNVNVGTSVSPFAIFETNIRGTYSVLEACRLNPRVERVVVASSAEADDRAGLGQGGAAAPSRRKRHPYQVSKISAELVAQAYSDTSGVPVAIARCDNIYGGRDLNWSRLIPGTIRSLLNDRAPVLRSDGSLERDYVYVEDMVRAYLALAARLDDPAVRGGMFHFATGASASVLSVVTRLSELVGRPDLKPVVLNESAGERVNEPRSTERERATLGWESRVDLTRGLTLTVDWYRRHVGRGSAVDEP